MDRKLRTVAVLAATLGLMGLIAAQPTLAAEPAKVPENAWPQWRGPLGTGAAPSAKGLPTEWDAATGKNVKWRTPLPGKSAATPAVWGDRVYLTSIDGEDTLALAFSLADGKELWRTKIGTGNSPKLFRSKNNMATPSPATDGQHVWVMTGGSRDVGGDVICLTAADGKEVWRRNLQKDYGPWTQDFGSGASFLLVGDSLYVPVLHRPESYIVALEAATGKPRWRTVREAPAIQESRDAYSTPIAVTVGGRTQIVVAGADVVTAHDAADGRELWRIGGLNPTNDKTWRIVATPVAGDGMVFAVSCKTGPMIAVKVTPELAGSLPESTATWTRPRDIPDQASPSFAAGLLYLVRQTGLIFCLDAADGKELWAGRPVKAGNWSQSPIIADGKVFVVNEQGSCVVLEAGREFKQLAVNELNKELTMASPVALPGRLLFRTEKALYCIAAP